MWYRCFMMFVTFNGCVLHWPNNKKLREPSAWIHVLVDLSLPLGLLSSRPIPLPQMFHVVFYNLDFIRLN